MQLIPFIQRNPTDSEVKKLILAMSVFRDGSGQEREKDGTTRPGWRDYERIIAEVLEGIAPENKDIFDIAVPTITNKNIYLGVSLKSKQLSRKSAIDDLDEDGRVHMELANSPAKFWDALKNKGYKESDFVSGNNPKLAGDTVIEVVNQWHDEAKDKFESENPGSELDLSGSVFMTISYSASSQGKQRDYQVHTFPIAIDENIDWRFISPRCLRGYDNKYPGEIVFDWYGLSGGQLKYYPRASSSIFSSPRFNLRLPEHVSILSRAETYWPDEWQSL